MTIKRALYRATVAAILTSGVAMAAPVLQLNPLGGVVSGLPGATVGWGFTLTNDVGFLIPTFVNFCEGASSSAPCPATRGTFTDFLAQFQSVAVGPGATLTESFVNATHQGIGAFTISPGAPAGAQDIGTIFVSYDRYSCDIINDRLCTSPTQLLSGRLSASAEIDVRNSAVPEPGTLAWVGLALFAMIAASRRRSLQVANLSRSVLASHRIRHAG